jgi:inner membrane protein
MVLAAEAPDMDFVYNLRGPLEAFQHHRGWTHSLLWIPVEAAVVVGLVAGFHYGREWWKKRRREKARAEGRKVRRRSSGDEVPLRWVSLWAMCLLALCSHLLLDWTNNYGVRPFAPFDSHWYAGEIVFIFEPVIFAMLLAALVLPSLFGLADREIGVKQEGFRGRGLAIAALGGMVAVWGYRAEQRNKAEEIARTVEYQGNAPIVKLSLNPYPINPYRWYAVVETPSYFQTGIIDVRTGAMETTQQDLFWKPKTTLATLAAKRSWLGRIYLDWSQFPLEEDVGPAATEGSNAGLSKVVFRDLRFMYNTILFDGRATAPLSARAYVDEEHRVVRVMFGSRDQKLDGK